MTTTTPRCEKCEGGTKRLIREESGVQFWRCEKCGDLLRWCPSCDQGWVRRATVKEKGSTVFVCDECETIWQSAPEKMSSCSGNLCDHLKKIGLQPVWSELDIVPEQE